MNRALKSRLVVVLLGVLVPLNALSESRVVPEDVLAEWGYATTRLERRQTIRQIEPLPDTKERWHPRFDLWHECFDNNDSALKRMAAEEGQIEAEKAMIYKSGLGMLVRGECIFFVSAHGTFFMLEFQPFIMRKLEEYLCSDQKCTRSTQLDDL